MAFALIVLAIGSVAAGWLGLGGRFEHFLEPSFGVHAAEEAAEHGPEGLLMLVSIAVAAAGIGVAVYFFLRNKRAADGVAERFAGLHRLLLNKYYVDEVYDATIVQPIKVVSTEGLWRGFDVKVVDGAVNGAGYFVSGVSIVLRLLQNGSVKTYAASMFAGAVAVLAFYLWR